MDNKYLYDAFISYRHTEIDKFVAETLHKELESFKLPKKLRKTGGRARTKINRVFRDKDELPLTSNLEDPIINALEQSEFLIVICSPRLPESIWCQKEIETFISMHGRHKVLAVLIEGEPDESFPDALLFDNVTVQNEDGSTSIIKKPVEPLAADFRGSTKKQIKKAMKSEILRLLAPMFDLSYDDLKRRHRERKIRKIIGVSVAVSIASILFAGYSAIMAHKIQKQNIKIEQQSQEIEAQNENLKIQAEEIEAQNQNLKLEQARSLAKNAENLLARDDRYGAVKLAYEAVTDYEGMEMPLTPEGRLALTECLGLYDGCSNVSAVKQLETPGIIDSIKVSPEKDLLLTLDSIGNLILWNVSDSNKLISITEPNGILSYDFINEDSFFYLNNENKLIKVNIADKNETLYTSSDSIFGDIYNAISTPDGKKIIVREMYSYVVLDAKNLTEISRYDVPYDIVNTKIMCSDDSSEAYIFAQNEDDGLSVISFNISDGSQIIQSDAPAGIISDVCNNSTGIYVLSFDFASYNSLKSVVTAYDRTTGEIKWTREEDAVVANKMYYSNKDGNGFILVVSDHESRLIDAGTGEQIKYYITDTEAVTCKLSQNGDFILYTSDGVCHYINTTKDKMDVGLQTIVCNNISLLDITTSGCVGVPENDNRVIIYTYRRNLDSAVFDGELAEALTTNETDDSILNEWGKENGIERAAFISTYLNIPDANLVLVAFVDESIEFYRADTMEFLTHYDDFNAMMCDYYGEVDGLYYITTVTEGIAVDKDGNIISRIDEMCGLSKDLKQVVVYGRDENAKQCRISIPIYSFEEIINRTKEFLGTEE